MSPSKEDPESTWYWLFSFGSERAYIFIVINVLRLCLFEMGEDEKKILSHHHNNFNSSEGKVRPPSLSYIISFNPHLLHNSYLELIGP